MFVLPIEPNLAQRARISTINLDDYQLDLVTLSPSSSSPFSMAAYQRMIAEMDTNRREEALTAYETKTEAFLTLHTILEDMDSYPNTCLEELEAFLTLWDVKPRVKESSLEMLSVDELITQLRQVCEDMEDRASNAQEEARQKRNEAMFIQKYCPRNEVKQMENELWNLKVKGTNLTAYNQRFQELILLCPEMVPNTDRLLERYIEGLPLNIKVGENSGDKRKMTVPLQQQQPNNTNNTGNLNPNKRPETTRLFTARQGSYAGKLPYCRKCGLHNTDAYPPTCHNCGRAGHKAKDYRAHNSSPYAKEGPGKPWRTGKWMLLLRDVAKRDTTRTSVRTMEVKAVEIKFEATNKILRTIRGIIKETQREITKHQPTLKEDAEHLAEYTAYVLKLR
ncbi:reverse transcriptase domain-containing protein [Tanacetum coccineum]